MNKYINTLKTFNRKNILAVILITGFTVFIFCCVWLYIIVKSNDAYEIIEVWNRIIENDRRIGNEKHHMCLADETGIQSVVKLNNLIKTNHSKILNELTTLLKTGYSGLPMSEMDSVQNELTNGSKLWAPVWIKFIDTWAGTADSIPTLKNIVKSVGGDILLLHISIFWPGANLPFHRGPSSGVLRYHYGLQIPEGSVGLVVGPKSYKWKNGEGIIWDDTIRHSAWNYTTSPRFVIFADIQRPLPLYKSIINKQIYKFIQHTKHVKEITKKLAIQGIKVD